MKAHDAGGDGHKTHVLVAELTALFARYVSGRAGKASSVSAADFMPWLKADTKGGQSVDEQINQFFRRFRS